LSSIAMDQPNYKASRAAPVNIESGFFYFDRPRTREDVENLRDRLHKYKEASIEAPLHPDLTLSVTNYMRSYHDHPSPRTRELPPLIRQWTGYTATMPLLVLQAPIQVGDRKWSQVWRGIMTSQDLPDAPPAPVIIKLFQESYLKALPSIADFWRTVDNADWLPGARLAANEAWAYDRMRTLQGRHNFRVTAVLTRWLVLHRPHRPLVVWVLQGIFCLVVLGRLINRRSAYFQMERRRLDMLWK
jgi:hypothetical protein